MTDPVSRFDADYFTTKIRRLEDERNDLSAENTRLRYQIMDQRRKLDNIENLAGPGRSDFEALQQIRKVLLEA